MRMPAIGMFAVAPLASAATAEEIRIVEFNIKRGFKSDAIQRPLCQRLPSLD